MHRTAIYTKMISPMVYVGLKDDYMKMVRFKVSPKTHDQIVMAICLALSIERSDLVGKSRKMHLTDARYISFYLFRKMTTLTFAQIGIIFNRDHSTVIHGVKMYLQLMENDISFRAKSYEVKEYLR